MRNIVNISMPKSMLKTLEESVKIGNFASKSEFIRHLIRLWNEKKLANELDMQKNDFKNGKGLKLKSLKDLR